MVFKIKDCSGYSESFYKNVFSTLSDFQKEKIIKLKDEKDKKLSLLAIHLIAEHTRTLPKNIKYINRKPTIDNSYISITHKYPYVGIAVSDSPIGIDLEINRDLDEQIIKYLKANDSKDALIKWTRFEAEYKSSLESQKKTVTVILENDLILSICQKAES